MLQVNYAAFIETLSEYWKQFEYAAEHTAECQNDIALNIVKGNVDSAFGKKHYFKEIESISDYQNAVPLQTYTSMSSYISEIAHGKTNVLTKSYPITHFELTSGSTNQVKMIPYTRELCHQFFRAIGPWLYNLYINKPTISKGKFFWVISPPRTIDTHRVSKVPIGESNDAIYFPESIQSYLAESSALTFEKKPPDHYEHFLAQQLADLLCCNNLSWLSLWNPSYMQALASLLENNANDVFNLIISKPKRQFLISQWKACHSDPSSFFKTVWKEINFISCWKDGSASQLIPNLERLFPNASIQGKGLMATEGIVSFPLLNMPGHVLAANSHFLEFISIETREIYLAHELEIGKNYEVVMTTAGGLYRYQLQDVIKVVGYYKQVPLIEFIGRNRVIDMVGEKLHEHTLTEIALQSTEHVQQMDFILMTPEQEDNKHFYQLFIVANINQNECEHLAKVIEKELLQHYHYAYARNIKQLQSARVSKLSSSRKAQDIVYAYYRNKCDIPMSMIKSSYIDPTTGWNNRFKEILAS